MNGHAVDKAGNAVADPSFNVGALVEAEAKRQDDLREAEGRRQDDLRLAAKELATVNDLHAKEIASLRDVHSTNMAAKESGRVDSLRQGDREENTRATTAAQANIASLALTTTQLADTLRNQVASTATAAENRQNAYSGDVGKRLTAVELSQSEGKGKQQVADPAMERLATVVERLARSQQTGEGVKQGTSDGVKLVIALLTLLSLYLGLSFSKPAPTPTTQPQVIYVPLPPGSAAPIQAPQAVPK